MYECDVCKKYSMQGGSCYGGRRNCLYFEKEPRGRVLQEIFLIDYGKYMGYYDSGADGQ